MKYPLEKAIDNLKEQAFAQLLEFLLSLIDEKLSIDDLINKSLSKICEFCGAGQYYFFVSEKTTSISLNLNQSLLKKYRIHSLIESQPEINFERLLNYLYESRELILTDNNGLLITDINKTNISNYYLCFPIYSEQSLLGGILFKFNTAYENLEKQIDNFIILVNTFSTILQKELLFRQYETSTLKFSRMINDAINGIYQSTEEGRIIYANPAFLKLVGYDTLEDIQQINLFTDMYVSEDERNKFIRIIKEKKVVNNYESKIKDKAGNQLVIIENSRLIEQTGGKIIFEGIIQDITQQTHLKDRLQYQTSLFEQIIENAPFSIIGVGETDEIILWNKAAEKVSGHLRQELYKDKNILNKIFCGSDFFVDIVNKVRENLNYENSIFYYDLEITSKFNEKKMLRWSGVKIDSTENHKELVLVFGIDITETKKLESQLVESQKMESIGTLAAGISYDFNKILGELNVYNSSLKSVVKDNLKATSYINKLEDSIERASTFTSKLIGLSRRELKRISKIDINSIINYVVDILEHTSGEEVLIEKDLSYNPMIEGDTSQIQQVILNISLNARDAIKESGSIKFTTEIILTKSDEYLQLYNPNVDKYVKITIADSGKGIPKELQERIFDPFFTTKSLLERAGLGLSVVYNIVRNHNGYIFVDSVPEKGSKFHVYFPFTGKLSKEIENKETETEKLKSNESVILVVDDENIIRDLLSDVLKDHNYKVILAKNGEEGVEQYKKHQNEIDVILLDIIMPGMSGKEVFEQVRAINPGAKIIITSGYSKQKVTDHLIANGANGFLPKPFNIDKLLGLIKALIEEN